MNNWNETTLGEIITLHYGKSLPEKDRLRGKVPVYGSSGVTGYHNQAIVDEEGLIVGRKGSVGSIYLSKIPFYPIDTVYFIRKSEVKCNWNYLYYLLKNSRLDRLDFDSVVPGLNRNIAYSELIYIPESEKEQSAIAAILSSLDNKIQLLQNQKKTLEKIAQTIFKRWFVEFEFPNKDGKPYKSSGGEMFNSALGEIPEEWKVGNLSDLQVEVTDYVANGSFASLKENVRLYTDKKEYALFIRNTDLKSSFTEKVYVDKHSYDFLSKTKLFGAEIIISNVGDVGSVHLCPILDIPMTLGNNVIMLKPNKYQGYLYTLFRSYVGKYLMNSITGGSAQPKFNKTDFRNLRFIIPKKDLLMLFNDYSWNMYMKVLKNNNQIQTLSQLRDTLLPKLMSGKIRVK